MRYVFRIGGGYVYPLEATVIDPVRSELAPIEIENGSRRPGERRVPGDP